MHGFSKQATDTEIEFLNGLGTYTGGGSKSVEEVPPKKRLELLRNYREGALKRRNWGNIDRVVIIDEVDRRISELSAQISA
jgi:hypothetical protein